MSNNPLLKRLLEAGVSFGEVTQTKADELMSILRESGVKRKEAEKTVMDLAEQARAQTDKFVARIKSELADQIVTVADRLDDLEDKIEKLAEKASGMLKSTAGRDEADSTTADKPTAGLAMDLEPMTKPVAIPRKAAAKKAAPVKKAVVKKAAPVKQATAKKAVAKKTTVKKAAPAKKVVAKKAAPAKRG